ncbi:hypothetical protein SDC9_64144 [bioreactor metagenome]|uniref:Flagellar motor switch protein FliN-like C-terminal domain-containing protein n=1 Tax=bioreactor metagenome TaxID=1076179 RepID=A0A644XNM9_9ZZZZ
MSRREGTSNGMADNIFNSMELDAIGEVMNISLGSSATAVSNLLDHRVEITTPRVSVCEVKDFGISDLEPAIGVEIRYISGLVGSNIMLLKRSDVKVIVDILMGSETPDEEFEMNELTISAVCEVMNQMMGAASTALSDFLGIPVNISTPESFELKNFEEFKKDHFPIQDGKCVVVRFMLKIDNMLQSEFINVMSVDLTRELLSGLGLGEDEDAAPPESTSPEQVASPLENGPKLSQAEIEKLVNSTQPTPQPTTPPASSGGTMSQAEIEKLMGNMQPTLQPTQAPQQSSPPPYPMPQGQVQSAPGGAYPMPAYGQYAPGYYPPPSYYSAPPQMAQPASKMIQSSPAEMPKFANGEPLDEQQAENLDLLMSVPLEVSVEIGRARRKVQDVLAFTKGSLVMLNKLAGDQVDLFVNGQCIAKGDVVVVDDNFGIRITEVLKSPNPNELING